MMACMLLCAVIWYMGLSYFESKGIVYPGHIGNHQVEQIIAQNQDTFVIPSDDFLAEYALFDQSGNLKISNVEGKKRTRLLERANNNDVNTLKHSYKDGSYAIFGWHFRKEFSNPVLRASLPPFEYLWWATLAIACVLCWLLSALILRKKLVSKLQLFRDVSEKIGNQKLDFEVPSAGIKEFDQALDAMEQMRQALYCSLSSQWAAQQQRDAEMSALAHDLKTPITLIGGNAELLLEDELENDHRKMIETIFQSNNRAKQYVNSLLETSRGEDEPFEATSLNNFLDEVYQNAILIAKSKNINLNITNNLSGYVTMQKDHLMRAIGNVVQNAVEYTKYNGTVAITGSITENGWEIIISDEGPGFSKAAIEHATERLWRDDTSRTSANHNGLGLWFASQVVKNHSGQLSLSNSNNGGVVKITFYQTIDNN